MRLCLFLLLLFASAARADEPPPGVTVYPAAYFADAAPATAADMVGRLPGFTLVDADDEMRGYAGAQGNVLIDGARPASKRESLDDLLERIPAHAVERIEVLRAGAAGHDFLGQAVLANIVRKPQSVIEGALEAGALADAQGGIEPFFQAEASRQWGEHALEVAAGSEPELDDDSGDGRRFSTDSDGTLLEAADTTNRSEVRLSHLTTNWTQPLADGEFGVFAALRDSRDRADATVATQFPQAGTEVARETETLQEAELGLRWSRALSARTALDAVASQRTGWLEVRSDEIEGSDHERFAQDTRSSESIARVDVRHERSPRLSFNGGLEFALNALDGDAVLFEDGESIALPGSRVRIEERRTQASSGAQWQAATAWRLEAGLAVESSRISQTGDSPLERDFVHWKPSLAARWERSDAEHWRLSLARDVGQLAFEDFVASASLDTDVITAGNATLEPDKTWRLALAWERSFDRDGAISLTLAHDEITDVVDRIPVASGDDVFDAPGNIGDGTRDSLALEFGTSLDRFGWPTLRLDATVIFQHSRVTDPSTGEMRGISEEKPVEGEIGLSQSLPAHGLKWGIDVELAEREREYRFDEIAREDADASVELFVERAFRSHWRLRAELVDPFGRQIVETRKGDGETQTRDHRVPAQLLLTLRRGMGG